MAECPLLALSGHPYLSCAKIVAQLSGIKCRLSVIVLENAFNLQAGAPYNEFEYKYSR